MLLTIGLELTLIFISIKYLTPSLMKSKKIYCQYGRQTSQSKNQHNYLPREALMQAPWAWQMMDWQLTMEVQAWLDQWSQILKVFCHQTLQHFLNRAWAMISATTLDLNMASSIILLSPAIQAQSQRTFTVILKVLYHAAHQMATPLVKYLHNQSY